MQIWRFYAFPFLLLSMYAGSSAGASGTPVVVPAEFPNPSGLPTYSSDSGFPYDDDDDFPRYVDDIYSQSGGVRVRTIELREEALGVYEEFVLHERQAQRAFLWHLLKLGNINFVHHHEGTGTPWVVHRHEPTFITSASLDQQTLHPTLNDEYRTALLDFVSDEPQHVSLEHVRNVQWNLDHLPLFLDAIVHEPRYNDKPHAASEYQVGSPTDVTATVAYNDPRYLGSQAVVNYRLNWRDLARERLDFLSPPNSLPGKEEDLLKWALNENNQRQPDEDSLFTMMDEQLALRGPDTIDIDVNVDAILSKNYAPEVAYKVIVDEIEGLLEGVYRHGTDTSGADAMNVLREIANTETQAANKYKKFNDPMSGDLEQLVLDKNTRMRDNIEKVYQRATIRRDEFHKMTEPLVVNDDSGRPFGSTYRVHFTDPERRYVTSTTTIVAGKPKKWYQALWTRLLEPIFKDAVMQEMDRITPLRNIILVNSDAFNTNNEHVLAYVTNNDADIVIHCDDVDRDHAMADETLRHEYEHIADASTNSRTTQRFARTEDDRDLDTLTMETLDHKIEQKKKQIEGFQRKRQRATYSMGISTTARWNALEASLVELEDARRAITSQFQQDAFNVYGCCGFPSWYARTDMREAVAEQRYAMRHEAIRIALLRRMALDRPGADAARVKQFYDIARDEMKDVAPQLYQQWGEYYDSVDRRSWGLLPGIHAQVDGHHQIIALDRTLATKMATEKLAAHFLLRGYDVAIMGETTSRQENWERNEVKYQPLPTSMLQSNLPDPPSGESYPKSILHLVGGSGSGGRIAASLVYRIFKDFTPTGRRNMGGIYLPHFEAVSVWRSPYNIFAPAVSTHVKLVDDFRQELVEFRRQNLLSWTVPEQISMIADGRVEIWPLDPNLYMNTIFQGWYDHDVAKWVWGEIDISCVQI